MSAKKSLSPRTWVEVSAGAIRANVRTFRKLIARDVALWAVVKSNAYGHELRRFAGLALDAGVDGLCVDSLIEGVRLREAGIEAPLLVIGPTLPDLMETAAAERITVSLATFEDLAAIRRARTRPEFHLKIDTGFHRRGFYVQDLPQVVRELRRGKPAIGSQLRGVYTHFASAKDVNYPAYTELQFGKFQEAKALLRRAGFSRLLAHAAASAGTLINKKYHEDAVRIGAGLYGFYPSRELEIQLPEIDLRPALSWHTYIAELKDVPKGAYVGYDLTERVHRRTRLALLPIGYWHGFPRALSSPAGEVLVGGRRARVLGRVSMDIVVVDVTGIKCRVGDRVTLIGKDGSEEISAHELASRAAGASPYELLTRLNPLMERRTVK